MRQLCYSYNKGYIKLIQDGFDSFTVEYGKQVDSNLAYHHAAAMLGRVLMHAAACDGRLDSDSASESHDEEPYFSCPVPI